MKAQDRRDDVLAAATRAFARSGFAGTSTDKVAKEAGVSQPYVVRIFGTKLDLFLAVLTSACERVRQTFEDAITERPFDPTSEEDQHRLGLAYTTLLADRDLLRVMMHGFSGSGEDEIGRVTRDRLGQIFETLKTTGWSDEQVRDFIAHGMLLNVLLATGALDHPDENDPLAQLVTSCLPDA